MEAIRKAKKHYLYKDYVNFPDSNRWEIIFGRAYMVPDPYIKHQDIVRNFSVVLVNYVNKKNIGKVYHAPTDVVLAEEIIVQPDILFITQERLGIITEKNIQGPPDLIVEVLSNDPKSVIKDKREKKRAYEKYGVREYIIIDYYEKYAEHYFLMQGKYEEIGIYGEDDKFELKTVEGLTISLKEILV